MAAAGGKRSGSQRRGAEPPGHPADPQPARRGPLSPPGAPPSFWRPGGAGGAATTMSGRGHNKLPTTERIVKGEGPGGGEGAPCLRGGRAQAGGAPLGWKKEGGEDGFGEGIPRMEEPWLCVGEPLEWRGGGLFCGASLLKESPGEGGSPWGDPFVCGGVAGGQLWSRGEYLYSKGSPGGIFLAWWGSSV